MRILAILILYNPDEKITLKIKEYANIFDFLFIWDNSAFILPGIKQVIKKSSNLLYNSYKVNIGLSSAYNKGIKYAKENKYDIIATLDQDSSFENLDKLIMFSKYYLKTHKSILGVDYRINRPLQGIELLPCDWVINSGLFISIDTINSIGGYNELFFVDGVDMELCLRARNANIFSYIFTGSNINQIYGELQSIKLFNKQFTFRVYSPSRVKEIVFSHILLYRKYHEKKILQELSCIIKLNIKTILLYHNRVSRFINLLRGIFKGLTTSVKRLDTCLSNCKNVD